MATTPKITIQKQFVAIATFTDASGQTRQCFVTNEWRRPLEDMANVLNTQQAAIATLQARLAAAGIP